MTQEPLFIAPEPPGPRFSRDVRYVWAIAPRPLFKKWMHSWGGDGEPILSPAWVEWHVARGLDPNDPRQRLHIAEGLRRAVLERDGYVCQLCGGEVDPDDVHLDHRHPVSRGGRTTLDNLQVAHSRCNLSKGARVLSERVA